MRGGKSFLLLLVLALALGGYAYFVEPNNETSGEKRLTREKLFAIESEKIDEMTVKAANGDVTKLKKVNGTWKIVSPAALEADTAEVSAITTALAGLESERVVEENPPNLKEFTLDPPRISVEFHVEGETGTHALSVGVKTPMGAELYGKLNDKARVFLIGSYREDALNKSLFNLRDKTVLTFDRDGANFLKIDDGKKPVVIAKQDNQWRLTTPIEAGADFTAVDGLVGRLYQSRMKSYVADDGTADFKTYGLDKPQFVVTVGAGSARVELAIGAKTDDGNVYARELTRPVVFTLEGTLLDDLKRPASELRQKDVFEFRTFTLLSLDVTSSGQTYTFTRDAKATDNTPATWKLTKPTAKSVDATKANDMLTNFSGLRADSFIDAASAGTETTVTARFGLDTAPKEETLIFRVVPSKDKTQPPVVHAIHKGEKGAMVISALEFDKAMAIFKELTGAK
ncbi:MAG: DUF4340 domain-containing protein [Acidobacteria bacterium]|nr:DUF4340 domain-containing protein [Acidobacteriota bacterium]